MGITTINTAAHAELGAAAAEDRLCTCDCVSWHPSLQVCSMIASEPGGICPGCDLDTLGSDVAPTLADYVTAAWSAWRVLTVDQAPEPVNGFFVVNAPWAGWRRGGRPAAIRSHGYVTHVGIIAEVHPAAACPDSWDGTTDCRPWGAAADPAQPRLAHWCLASVVELFHPVRHKLAGWMTPGTQQTITAQL